MKLKEGFEKSHCNNSIEGVGKTTELQWLTSVWWPGFILQAEMVASADGVGY